MLLSKGEITPPWHPSFPGCFDHQLEQVQDLRIPDPARYLPEQQVMPHGPKIVRQVQVDHPRPVLHDGLGHPRYRPLRRPLRAIPVRTVVKIRLEDRLHNALERPLNHAIPYGRDP
jgi:hypothetical protein